MTEEKIGPEGLEVTFRRSHGQLVETQVGVRSPDPEPRLGQPDSGSKYFRIENGQAHYYYAHLFSIAFCHFLHLPFY